MGGHDARVYGGLALGVVAVSWAAIFIRLADAPALAMSAYRMGFAAAPVAAMALVFHRDELRRLTSREWALLTLSGVALALHFATWIASLGLTTVASSVALVATQPVWVALLAGVLLGERITARGALAIAIATTGCIVIGGVDFGVSRAALAGDGLAVAGAICGAIYFMVGRRVRPTLSLVGYVGVVYGVALIAGRPVWGYSGTTWALLVLMAAVPQLLGHSLLNWSLRYLSVPFVSVAILGEPVLSAALAVPILGELPGTTRIVGGAITLIGVYLAVRDETRRAERKEAGDPEHTSAGREEIRVGIEAADLNHLDTSRAP